MAPTQLTDDDVGKQVVISDGGDQVGIVQEVRDETAYVDPDPDILDKVQVELNWEDGDEDTYLLNESDVAEVTTDEIRLR